eukprot:scaffold16392_cov15-Tisochrysis_lutea.AAC.1
MSHNAGRLRVTCKWCFCWSIAQAAAHTDLHANGCCVCGGCNPFYVTRMQTGAVSVTTAIIITSHDPHVTRLGDHHCQ